METRAPRPPAVPNPPDASSAAFGARLQHLLAPTSIAVVGASDDPTKLGSRPIRYLSEAGYGGEVFPVNPRRAQIGGRPAHASVERIGRPVDLALILLPAEHALEAVEDCARSGVRAAIVFSAGFAEVGGAGRVQQDRIRHVAGDAGLALLGPNCLGAVNVHAGVVASFSGSISLGLPRPGNIGFATQSGGTGSHCMVMMVERGLGLSKWVTTGNEVDIDVAECIAHLANDAATEVIIGYLEGARDGERLAAALAAARANAKPVVLLKAGGSTAGARAARSHTDAIVGSDAVYDAVFAHYGVHRAASIDDLFNKARALSSPRPPGRELVVANLGGALTGMIEEGALLRGLVPRFLTSPTTADPDDALVGAARASGDRWPATTLVFAGAPAGARGDRLVDRLVDSVPPTATRSTVLVAALERGHQRRLQDAGFLVVEDVEHALDAIEASVAAAERALARPRPRPRPSPEVASAAAETIARSHLSEVDALALVEALGVPTIDHVVTADPEDAVTAATGFGYPVVLKVVSPVIAHKTEIGGVALGLAGPAEVRRAFGELWRRGEAAAGPGGVDGILVAPMVRGGVELLLALRVDPAFGPVVVCGLGGRLVEVYRDVAVRVPPVGPEEARAMLSELSGAAIVRSRLPEPATTLDKAADTIARFSERVLALDQHVAGIEINPLVVGADGHGPVALDALIVGPGSPSTTGSAPQRPG